MKDVVIQLILEHLAVLCSVKNARYFHLMFMKYIIPCSILLKGPVISSDDASVWKCLECSSKFSSASINKIVLSLDEQKNSILSDPAKKKISVIEKFITKCSKTLHCKNLLIARLKYNLIGLYGREKSYTTQVILFSF